jgi:uncharacterized protein
VPAWAAAEPAADAGALHAIVRTAAEVTVVCPADRVPRDVRAERGWRALAVEGPLDLALTGVLAALLEPLARAGIPIFAVSTYDTDHVLVRAQRLDEAVAALSAAGHRGAGG